jgi:CheY-like chemotaxis protein
MPGDFNSMMLGQFDFGQPPGNNINMPYKAVSNSLYDLSGLGQNSAAKDLANTFTSALPTLPSRSKPVSTVGHKWSAPPKVLLVEDDDTCRRLSSKLLQIFGCNFDIAVDGLDAVNRMNVGYKYDIVLMDIMMPNLDGVSATTRIRQFDQLTPIISMTSNITENDCMTYLANGMNDILVKPFNKSALLGMIKRHCADRSTDSPTFSDDAAKITDISSEDQGSSNQIDSQLLGLMRMDRNVSSFISEDSSFTGSKRAKRSREEELENMNGDQ